MQYVIAVYTKYSHTSVSIPVEKIPGSETLTTVDVRLGNNEILTVDSRDVFYVDEEVSRISCGNVSRDLLAVHDTLEHSIKELDSILPIIEDLRCSLSHYDSEEDEHELTRARWGQD